MLLQQRIRNARSNSFVCMCLCVCARCSPAGVRLALVCPLCDENCALRQVRRALTPLVLASVARSSTTPKPLLVTTSPSCCVPDRLPGLGFRERAGVHRLPHRSIERGSLAAWSGLALALAWAAKAKPDLVPGKNAIARTHTHTLTGSDLRRVEPPHGLDCGHGGRPACSRPRLWLLTERERHARGSVRLAVRALGRGGLLLRAGGPGGGRTQLRRVLRGLVDKVCVPHLVALRHGDPQPAAAAPRPGEQEQLGGGRTKAAARGPAETLRITLPCSALRRGLTSSLRRRRGGAAA